MCCSQSSRGAGFSKLLTPASDHVAIELPAAAASGYVGGGGGGGGVLGMSKHITVDPLISEPYGTKPSSDMRKVRICEIIVSMESNVHSI